MFVIRVRIGDDLPWYFLHGFCSGRVELSRSYEKTWFINSRGEAFSIAAAVHHAVYNLEPLLDVQAVPTSYEDLVDFDAPFNYEYVFVED